MVQSEATVANRVQELIYARNATANAEDNLKALLGFDLPHEWQVEIEATDSYNMEPVLPDLEKSIETALDKRPAIIRQELELERLDHNVKVARNGALPQLDLTGSYGWSGVSGKSTITDPETGEPITIREGWGDAASQVFEFDLPEVDRRAELLGADRQPPRQGAARRDPLPARPCRHPARRSQTGNHP